MHGYYKDCFKWFPSSILTTNAHQYCFKWFLSSLLTTNAHQYCFKWFVSSLLTTNAHQYCFKWFLSSILTTKSQCIDSEEANTELLEEIVQLWVTVRGFAMTATWLETFKVQSNTTTAKKPSLRKGLQ